MKSNSWKGISDSTPSSDPHTNPLDQPDRAGKSPDWRGLEDGTPASTTPTPGINARAVLGPLRRP
jgi:hypothetical protein